MNLNLLLFKIQKTIKKIKRHGINEMSLIGYIDKDQGSYKQKVYVHDEPDYKEPHFHVQFSNKEEYVISIINFRIIKGPTKTLNNKTLKYLVNWLKQKHSSLNISNWEFIHIMWNEERYDNKLTKNYELPSL
jgi:hypothetical protein